MLGFVRTYFRMILSAACLAGSFIAGIFFSGFDKPYFAPSLILVAVSALVALWPGFRKGWSFPAAPVAAWLAAFWLWLGISLTWSQIPYVSMIFFVTISTMPLLFFAFVQSPRGDDFIRFCRNIILIPVALLALSTLGQFFFLTDYIRDRINYPMLNPNNLAETLMMGIFLILPLFVMHKSIAGKLIPGIVIVLSMFAILTTQSRGGTLGLIVGSVIFMLVCNRSIRSNWKSFALLALGLAAAWISYSLIAESRYASVHLFGGGDAPEAVRVRYELWKSGWAMLMDYGFTGGVGLGSFYLTFPPYRQLSDTSDGFFLHVDPFQFGIETGLPATILFYAFATAILVRTINMFRAGPVPQDIAVPVICGFGGMLGLLINAHLDYPLYMVTSQIMAALFISSWYRGTEDILDTPRFNLTLRNRAHRIFMIPLLVIFFALIPVWIVRAGYGIVLDGQVNTAMQAGNYDEASRYAQRSHLYAPDSYDRGYMLDGIWRVRLLQQQFYNLEPDTRQMLYEDGLKYLDIALDRNPYSVPALNQKAMLQYVVAPRLDVDGVKHARETLEESFHLDPVSFEVRMALARMYDLEGRPMDAIRILEGSFQYQLAQNFAPPTMYYLLAEMRQKTGDASGAMIASKQGEDRAIMFNKGIEAQGIGVNGWVDRQIDTLMGKR